MKRLTGAILLFSIAATLVLFWAHQITPPEEILLPLPSSNREMFLKEEGFASQPILVTIDTRDTNVFARYITEILKCEGLFTFETADLARTRFNGIPLDRYSLIITATSSAELRLQTARLTSYVRDGGNLLMLAPTPEFDALLGVRSLGLTLNDGYIQFDSLRQTTKGLTFSPLQFFGSAALLEQKTTTPIAILLRNSATPTHYPAVGLNTYGKGSAAFFAFDLGRSIVFTRQGKLPTGHGGSSFDKNSDGVYNTSDLFFETHDYTRTAIPQADEQQKLLAKLILTMLEANIRIPRVWYFPDGAPCIALITGDSHGSYWNPTVSQVADSVSILGGRGSFTIFNYPEAFDSTLLARLREEGHGIAPHLYYKDPSNRLMRLRQQVAAWFSSTAFYRPRLSDLLAEVERGAAGFKERTGSFTPVNRFHFLVWWGWTQTPQILAQHGFEMDLSITGMNPRFPLDHPDDSEHASGGYGYINGSGQPMKFISPQGELINLFGQLTQIEDDVLARDVLTSVSGDSIVTNRLIEISQQLINESKDFYHTALVWNFHPEHTIMRWPPKAPTTSRWLSATVRYLADQDIPMVSAEEWLRFVRARYGIRIDHVAYDAATRKGSFTLVSPYETPGVTIHIPTPARGTLPKSIEAVQQSKESKERIPIHVTKRTVDAMEYIEVRLNLKPNLHVACTYAF